MVRRLISRDRVLAAGVVLALLFSAMAAIGTLGASNDVVYYACIEKRSGTLYNVSTSSNLTCKFGDQSIEWFKGAPSGIADLSAYYGGAFPMAPGERFAYYAECPEGLVPISGGFQSTLFTGNATTQVTIISSKPVAGTSPNPVNYQLDDLGNVPAGRYAWRVEASNDVLNENVWLGALAICARVAQN